MKRQSIAIAFASLLTLCLATAGCDSQGTREVKREAKAIDESYKAKADLVEATAKNSPNPQAAENKAQVLRDQGEVERKYLVKEAEQTQKATH